MTTQNKLLLGWKNVLAQMTLSATIAAESNYPLSNLVNQRKRKCARFDITGKAGVSIKGTSADEFAMTALLMAGHNMAEDSTVRIRIWDDENQTGTVMFDSDNEEGADKIFTVRPWGEMIAGYDPWGGGYDATSRLSRVYSLAWPTIKGKSFQLDLTVPSPVNSIIEIDKLALFFGWEPKHNFDWGASFSIGDKIEPAELESGGVFAKEKPSWRLMDIDFGLMEDTERNRMLGILDEAGKVTDLYVIPDPSDTGFSRFMGAGIYRRTSQAGYEHVMFDGSESAVSLREN